MTWWGKLAGPFGSGLVTSFKIFALTLLLALPLGLVVSLGEMARGKAGHPLILRAISALLRMICKLFVMIMRGTPLMLQLLFVYFAPFYLFGITSAYGRFTATVIAFVLNYSAYFAEIYRGGIESMARGQYEAGEVLGFTRGQIFFRIILPQVIKRILPPMSNEVITLLKDTALVQVLGVADLLMAANTAATNTLSVVPFVVAAVIYFVVNLVVERLFHLTERRLAYYR